MMKTLIINLFGAPSSGKSTFASGLFSYLKKNHYDVYYLQEFVKDKIYHDPLACKSELYLTGNFLYNVESLEGKVDILLLDSNLLSGIIYGNFQTVSERDNYKNLILEIYNRKNNLNLCLRKIYKFEKNGRLQNEKQATDFDLTLENILKSLDVFYHVVKHDDYLTVKNLIDNILKKKLDDVESETISCNTCKYNDRRKDIRHLSSLFYCSKNYEHMLDDKPCKCYIKDDYYK